MKNKDIFINVLDEMTLNNAFEQTDGQVAPYFEYLKTYGKHVGDQDGLEIWAVDLPDNDILFGIKQNDIITTICTFNKQESKLWILKLVHSLKQFRGTKHAHKILWFIKNQEHVSILDYGVQTTDGMRFYKSVAATGRFKMSWHNIKTGENIPYDVASDNKNNIPYRNNIQPTDWRILIEGDSNIAFDRYDRNLVKGLWRVFE